MFDDPLSRAEVEQAKPRREHRFSLPLLPWEERVGYPGAAVAWAGAPLPNKDGYRFGPEPRDQLKIA